MTELSSLLFGRVLFPLLCVNTTVLYGFCPASCRKTGGRWWLSLLETLGLSAAAMVLDALFVDPSNWTTTFEPFLDFLAGYAVSMLVFRMHAGPALFISVWSHIIAELAEILYMPATGSIPSDTIPGFTLRLLCLAFFCVIAFIIARQFLAPALQLDGEYPCDRSKILLLLGVLAFFLLFSNYQFVFAIMQYSPPGQVIIIPVFRAVVGFCALFMLYIQNATEKRYLVQRELDLSRSLMKQQQEQFELSKENIDLINRKCHDLKHQIAALRTIHDKDEIDRQITGMESAVMIYDSAMKTGNKVLDVVLTDKSLYCEMNHVNLTCMIDGSPLGFVDGVDLYAMFANALDNAIEYVMTLPDETKRIIQVSGHQQGNLMLIRIRNYCEKPPELVDGLPATTKDNTDYHGFGLRSIQKTAENYGGGISIETGSNYYTLQILLPVPA